MGTRSRSLLTAMTAAVFMSLVVSAASARRFEVSNQRYVAIWTLMRFETPFGTVECPVTMEGSFHSKSISKVSAALIGQVTSAKIRGGTGECLGSGAARVHAETLPWHMQYDSFVGALPSITRINLLVIGATFEIKPAGVSQCQFRSSAAKPWGWIAELSGNTTLTAIASSVNLSIPFVQNLPFCESGVTTIIRGVSEVFLQGSTSTRITVRLVP